MVSVFLCLPGAGYLDPDFSPIRFQDIQTTTSVFCSWQPIFLGLNYIGFITGIKYISPSSSQVFIQIAPVSFALSGILFSGNM